MDKFAHIRMVMGFITSLSIAHLLRGLAKFIVHPKRSRPYWLHVGWVLYLFLLLINFWWWEFRLNRLSEWTFGAYLLVITYIVLYYILCFLLFPEDLNEYPGFRAYYYAQAGWFFGLLALTFLVDIADTLLKGRAYFDQLEPEYLTRTAVRVVLCVSAMLIRRERYHAALLIGLFTYDISWILRHYYVE